MKIRTKGFVIANKSLGNDYLAFSESNKLYDNYVFDGYFWTTPTTYWKLLARECRDNKDTKNSELLFATAKDAESFWNIMLLSGEFGDMRDVIIKEVDFVDDVIDDWCKNNEF